MVYRNFSVLNDKNTYSKWGFEQLLNVDLRVAHTGLQSVNICVQAFELSLQLFSFCIDPNEFVSPYLGAKVDTNDFDIESFRMSVLRGWGMVQHAG